MQQQFGPGEARIGLDHENRKFVLLAAPSIGQMVPRIPNYPFAEENVTKCA